MPDQLAEIKKSIDGVSKGLASISKVVGELRKTQEKAPERESRRVVVDVDALTDAEVSELVTIIEADGRDPAADVTAVGMRQELKRLGFINCLADGTVYYVDPLASWAVEKRRQRAEEHAAELERQWRHDRTMTWIAAIAGLAGAVIGAVLTVALTCWLLPK